MPTQDLICLSHLRWGFVYQRPNHLMARCAKKRRVLFFEEPRFDLTAAEQAKVDVAEVSTNVFVATPRFVAGTDPAHIEEELRRLLRDAAAQCEISTAPILWFYTPMALPLVEGMDASLVVFDAMDELSAFNGAPPMLLEREKELFQLANVVFTGGQSLYESKRRHHPVVHAFPSSVDAAHFGRARETQPDPPDQLAIPHPRIGYFGVIDERLDLDLLARLADERPDLNLVMVGPVVKIDEATLPRRRNIHYLGGKSYDDLPKYLAGWDVAMMPFALNAATAFISPTKTLEYLAAAKPIVSTPIRDVVRPYGENGSVLIAAAHAFAEAVDRALDTDLSVHRGKADEVVRATSWDRTWDEMESCMRDALAKKGLESCSTISS